MNPENTRRPRVYGMVSLAASADYTHHSLKSFAKTTLLTPGDSFHLIINDHHKVSIPPVLQPLTNAHLRDKPASFAENGNALREIALQSRADLYFLNNDIIFTPLWSEFLAIQQPVITIPLCNQDLLYEQGGLKLATAMNLEDYLGHEKEFETIVKNHQSKTTGAKSTLCAPFFCVRIPLEVLSVVGEFDTSFGKGGAEDNDYSLRTHLNGFSVIHSLRCYLLHFMGRSTWRGAESPDETKTRDELYFKRFQEKWGEKLTALCIQKNNSIIQENPELKELAQSQKWGELVSKLTPEETLRASKSPTKR